MEEKLIKVMAAVFGVQEAMINKETTPATVAEWDSLAQIKLILALEEELGIQFSDDDLAQMQSYEGILSVIKKAIHA